MVLVLCLVVLQYEVAQAAVYSVGDARGWTFNTVGWPNRKSFKAGDILVFKYSRGAHNVVVVDKVAYG
ncbi:hypothetical protein Q8G47_29300, partial [Klebsiella pneumoniae]|uniref:hypothetical protein n=1 Tax=Klebsiella pneumoniae TaxID=573 RepID=UPI003013EB3E